MDRVALAAQGLVPVGVGALLLAAACVGITIEPVQVALVGFLAWTLALWSAFRSQTAAPLLMFLLFGWAYLALGGLLAGALAQIPGEMPLSFQKAQSLNLLLVGSVCIAHDVVRPRLRGATSLPFSAEFWVPALVLITLAAVAGGIVFFVRAGGIPLLMPGESARIEPSSGNSYPRTLLLGLVIPAAAFVITRVASRDFVKAVAAMVLVFVVLLGTGFRSDAGWFVILTLLALWLYGVRVPPILVAGLFVVLGVTFSAVVLLRAAGGSEVSLVSMSMNLLGVHTANEALLIQVVDHRIGHVYGLTYVWNFSTLLPGAQPDMSTWIKGLLGARFEGGGITPTLAGEAYFNFGWLGAPIVGAVLGCALAVLGRVRTTAPTHALIVAVATAALVHAIPGGLGNQMVVSLWQFGLAMFVALPLVWGQGHQETYSETGTAGT